MTLLVEDTVLILYLCSSRTKTIQGPLPARWQEISDYMHISVLCSWILFCIASPTAAAARKPVAPRTRVARHARIFAGSPLRCVPSIGSQVRLTRLDSAERAGHVLRTLPLAKLVSLRPTIRKSGVFELSVSSSPILSFCLRSDGYHFVLFTLFCDFDTLEVYGLFSIRPPVYGEYILTCWISICLYLSVYAQEWQSTSWLMRQRRDRAMNCITEYNIEGRTLPCRPIDFYDTQNPM